MWGLSQLRAAPTPGASSPPSPSRAYTFEPDLKALTQTGPVTVVTMLPPPSSPGSPSRATPAARIVTIVTTTVTRIRRRNSFRTRG
jgi:hypothetical protein